MGIGYKILNMGIVHSAWDAAHDFTLNSTPKSQFKIPMKNNHSMTKNGIFCPFCLLEQIFGSLRRKQTSTIILKYDRQEG